MAFKDFSSLAVLTADEVDTYLMRQAVIKCTAATQPASPDEGMVIYETDTDLLRVYLSDWVTISHAAGETSWTPALTASSSNPTLGSGSTQTGGYVRQGRLITFWGQIVFGSSGTAAGSGNYQVSLPFQSAALWEGQVIGNVELNNSGTSYYRTARIHTGGTYAQMYGEDGAGVTDAVPFAWSTSDFIRYTGSYVALA